MTRFHRHPTALACALLFAAASRLAAQAMPAATLAVDASEAPRKIFHAHLVVPATAGDLTLVFPKWIPGEHGPTGPLVNLVNVKLSAGGQPLAWRRDPVEMYALHLTVPAGAKSVEADYDFLAPLEEGVFTAGASTTSQLSLLSWNTLLLYPAGHAGEDLPYTASLKLPAGWTYSSALHEKGRSGDTVRFDTVSMTTLIDSPVLMGAHMRKVDLPSGSGPKHEIDMAADSASFLETPEDFAADYGRLVAESGALFGARHYTQYHFLLTMSDHTAHFGLEHHESSDDRVDENILTKESLRHDLAGLLAHEFVHSWNGKYRRPAGLVDPDYQQPMQGELLWVYEGLTQYLGYLLPARSAIWPVDELHERLAMLTANLDIAPGRTWRPLADTAVGAQVLFGSPTEWRAVRRGTDFYDESVLIWLEADTTIRRLTNGQRSMDDFCHRFHGGQSGAPKVVPYTFDDVVSTLNDVAPYDWGKFLKDRLTSLAPHAPMAGLEASGWKLVYSDTPNQVVLDRGARNKVNLWTYSLGMDVKEDGTIREIIPGLPAAKAGLAPGMKMVAVNGRAWTKELVEAAIVAAKGGTDPIGVLVTNADYYRTYLIDYHGGPRYPHLEKVAGKPDVLGQIAAPHATGGK